MATDVLPFVVPEAAAFAVGIDGDEASAGATPSQRTGKMGVWVLLGGATTDGLFDFIVETAPASAGPLDNWQQLTSSRLNGETGAGIRRIPVVDPILDQVRLRATRTGGSGASSISVRWGSDRNGMTAN